MKKLFIAVLLFVSLSGLSQTKDTVKTERQFFLIMGEAKWGELIALIKTADEKPSIIKQWIDLIMLNAKELKTEKTDSAKAKK